MSKIQKNTLLSAVALVAAACNGEASSASRSDDLSGVRIPNRDVTAGTQWDQALAARDVDYGQALRSAALKLVGDLPTLAEVKFVSDAADHKAAYEAVIDAYLEDPRFAVMVRRFFRDTFVPRDQIVGRATAIALSVDLNHHWLPRWARFFSSLP